MKKIADLQGNAMIIYCSKNVKYIHPCSDNCPEDNNPTQADGDGDGIGDVCGKTKITFLLYF